MNMTELLTKVDKMLGDEFRIALRAQGHYNTGKLDQSIEGTINGDTLEGTAAYYALVLNYGFDKSKASMKQFPFLVNFFLSKSYDEDAAKRLAAMTIRSWMREGMPSSGGYVYSETGLRTKVIEVVRIATTGKIDKIMKDGIDKMISDKFKETKSETI